MPKRKFIDFDRFWSEMKPEDGEELGVRVFGEDVVLPSSPPALIVLRYLRQAADPEAEVEPDFMVKIAEALFGQERLNRWLEKGLTLQQLVDLVTQTVRMYLQDEDSGDEADDAEGDEGNR